MNKILLFAIALASVASAQAQQQQSVDYTNGFFILNEDWYGHNSSTVNFYSNSDQAVHYRVFQAENPGRTLGNTTQFAQLYGGKIYFVSKQNYGETGGRLDVADAATLKSQASLATLGGNDGRSFCGLSSSEGLVATSGGVYAFDLTNNTLGDNVFGNEEVGDMVRVGRYVYLTGRNSGLVVLDAATHAVVGTYANDNLTSVFVTRSGKVVANVNSSSWGYPGASATEQFIVFDAKTGTPADTITVPAAAQNTWFAWKHTTPAVAKTGDVIFYSPAEGTNVICRYDFATGEFKKDFVTFPDGQQMYGGVVGIDPVSGDLLATTFAQYGSKDYWLHIYDPETGAEKKSIKLDENYWFPAMFFYPDNAAPVINVSDQNLTVGHSNTINLLDSVTDADNLSALIVTNVAVADNSVATATVDGFDLTISGLAKGTTTMTLTANSNGRVVTRDVQLNVEGTSGVENVAAGDVESVRYYNLQGVASAEPFDGVNVVVTRYANGTVTTTKQVIRH